MSRLAIGLDIGGANLKLATSDGQARSRPFELWKHPDRLTEELREFVGDVPADAPVGATMTGELCDCFETKRDGVRHILAAVREVFGLERPRVWGTSGRFLTLADAGEEYLVVAAANWHALATFAGRYVPTGNAVLIDVGSTTTDVIPIVNGLPTPLGLTDPARLDSFELVYLGVKRTPVCALVRYMIANEWFATTQDVHVLLGDLPEDPADCNSADARPMTRRHAHARLSRMLGGDPLMIPEAETRRLAEQVRTEELGRIGTALNRVGPMQGKGLRKGPHTWITSGSGEFLARAAIEPRPGDRISLSERLGPTVSEAACAYAVAVLTSEQYQAAS
jgi:(4-(4-[2-(gamma-L-glutamylamino)ethyl]phenoxymethyl)furan-2-yl)methanamine synthase